jgi:hypothetical protein
MTRWISVTLSTSSPLDARPHVRAPDLQVVTLVVAAALLGPPLVYTRYRSLPGSDYGPLIALLGSPRFSASAS